MTDDIIKYGFYGALQTEHHTYHAAAGNRAAIYITTAEAERDEARATLAAARAMLDATGAALADATKRIEAQDLEIDRLKDEVGGLLSELAYHGIYS